MFDLGILGQTMSDSRSGCVKLGIIGQVSSVHSPFAAVIFFPFRIFLQLLLAITEDDVVHGVQMPSPVL